MTVTVRVPTTDAPAGRVPDGAKPDNRVLLILAADHRGSLERGLYGLTAPPTPAQAARISADKLLVYQALLDVTAWLPAQIQLGVLMTSYGASVAELASHSARRLGCACRWRRAAWWSASPTATTGSGKPAFAAGHVKFSCGTIPAWILPPRAASAAARPGSAWAARGGRSLILELLVPATGADKDATEGSMHRYDDELRPGYTVQVMEYLQDHGVEPALWTVEGLDRQRRRLRWPRWRNRRRQAAASRAAGSPVRRAKPGCRRGLPPGLGSDAAARRGYPRTPTCATSTPPGRPGADSRRLPGQRPLC